MNCLQEKRWFPSPLTQKLLSATLLVLGYRVSQIMIECYCRKKNEMSCLEKAEGLQALTDFPVMRLGKKKLKPTAKITE